MEVQNLHHPNFYYINSNCLGFSLLYSNYLLFYFVYYEWFLFFLMTFEADLLQSDSQSLEHQP